MEKYDDVPEDIANALIDYAESTGKYDGWEKTEESRKKVVYKIRVNDANILVKRWWETKALIPYKIEHCVEFNDKHYHGRNAGMVFDVVHEKFGSYLEEQNKLVMEKQKIEEEQKKIKDAKKTEDAFREKVFGKR